MQSGRLGGNPQASVRPERLVRQHRRQGRQPGNGEDLPRRVPRLFPRRKQRRSAKRRQVNRPAGKRILQRTGAEKPLIARSQIEMAFLAVLFDELEILADIGGQKGKAETQTDPHRLFGQSRRRSSEHKTKGDEPVHARGQPFAPVSPAVYDVSRLFHRRSDCAVSRAVRSRLRKCRRSSSRPAACARSRRRMVYR